MPLAPGSRIGVYEVTSAIGAGGMGEVYRARDSKLKRDVALKVLPVEVAADPERLARFQREAETLASLNHPHIAQIYGVEDRALVMELVEGEDVAQLLTRGPVSIHDALTIASQIAGALEAAHEAGIVHRDLKPANVKVRPDGMVKVLDFGLAKALGPSTGLGLSAQGDPSNSPTITSPMTQLGVILGTPAYMSPEQAKGRIVDKRADIWAFGCVLFEMLTGRRAFAGDSVSETLAAILKEPPPLELLPPSTPPAIVRVLTRCLEKDPARRLRDIADARFDIDDVRAGKVDTAGAVRADATTTTQTWIRRGAWALAGAAAMAVVAFAVRPAPSEPATVARLTVRPAGAPLVVNGELPSVALSPDGQRLIYGRRRIDAEGSRLNAAELVSRPLDAFDITPLANLGLDPRGAFLSADGAWIGFETQVGVRLTNQLAKVPVAGGPMTILCSLDGLGSLRGASWGNDGRIVFATGQTTTGLFEVAAAGGTPRTLTTPAIDQGERDHVWPDLLPDNAGILFSIARSDATFDIAVLPAGSSTWRTLIRGGTAPRYLASGHLLYVNSGVLYGVGFDRRQVAVTTAPVALVDGILTKASGAADLAVSNNGTLAYVPGSESEAHDRLVWLSHDGTTQALPLDPGAYRRARLSPDGRRTALEVVERGPTGARTVSIWIYDTSRGTFARVTPRGEPTNGPLWSPDGRRLAFWSGKEKGIFTIAPEGAESAVRLTSHEPGMQWPDAWSPDGATLAFIQERPQLGLFAVQLAAPHDVKPMAEGSTTNVEAAFSPDGRWVAHIAFDGRSSEVVAGPVGSIDRRWSIASGGRYPVWSDGGRTLMFIEAGSIYRIAMDPATGRASGKVSKVVALPPRMGQARHLNPSSDGKRFLMLERVDSDNAPSEIRVVLNWLDEVRTKMAAAGPPTPQ